MLLFETFVPLKDFVVDNLLSERLYVPESELTDHIQCWNSLTPEQKKKISSKADTYIHYDLQFSFTFTIKNEHDQHIVVPCSSVLNSLEKLELIEVNGCTMPMFDSDTEMTFHYVSLRYRYR